MKVLIWNDFAITNTGGPSGYIYNIYEYLKQHPTDNIEFLSDIKESLFCKSSDTPSQTIAFSREALPPKKSFFQTVYRLLDNPESKLSVFSLKVYHSIKRRFYQKKSFFERILFFTKKQFVESYYEDLNIETLNRFDFIHFHILTQFTRFVKTHPNLKSKTILTSHCPSLYVDEKMNEEKKWMLLFRPSALKKECEAYSKCDYLMFPCPEATEPYVKTRIIRKVFRQRDDRIIYVPTSLLDVHNNYERKNIRKLLGIPSNNFVITFFGRHNYVKGYDILKKNVISILNKHDDCTIVCAGVGTIQKPNHDRWIELGFVNNIIDYLSISDLHIIPNRETYFDIAMLEALRAGKHIITSRTGGNKYFFNHFEKEMPGLHFFDIEKTDELKFAIEEAIVKKQNNEEEYNQEGIQNRIIFQNYFNMPKFIELYIRKLKSLK